MERSDISAVVVSYNSARWLPACVDAVLAAGLAPERLVVVDNASSDGSADLVRQRCPRVRVVRSATNLGFGGGANLGIRQSATDTVVVLNPDVVVGPGTLVALGRALAREPQAAVAGGKLLFPDDKTIQHAGGTLSYPLALADHYGYGEEDRGQCDEPREVEFVTGALFAVRRSVLDEIGYFDEGFYPAYFEDSDLCFRARQAGYKVLYIPEAVATHHESATTGRRTPDQYRLYHRNRLRFVLKHYTDEQLYGEFLPVELRRLSKMDSGVELAAQREAYRDNLAALEGRADFLANTAAGAACPNGGGRLAMLRVLDDASTFAGRIATLRAKARVVERPFASKLPVAGPLVVRVRELWNWMSTRWYVRPLTQQQNEFNACVVESLELLYWSLQAMTNSLVGRAGDGGPRDLDVARLETRLRRIEERLDGLQQQLAAPQHRESPRD